MSETITIIADLNTKKVERKVSTLEKVLKKVNADVALTERRVWQVARSAGKLITRTIGFARTMATAIGGALPPVYDAIFTAISNTILSLQSIAAAYAAGIVTAPVAAAVEMAALSLSYASVYYALTGQEEMRRHLDRMESALSGLSGVTSSYGEERKIWRESG